MQKMVYSCSKCHKAITEPMVSKCDNRYWHSSCLTCQMCGHTPSVVGEQSMYMFRGSLICKNDYMRINCVCKTCSRPLSQSDMVIKANGYGYMHDKCVFCGRCQHRLETGDRFMLTTDQMIVCQKCIMQQHPQGPPNSGVGPNSTPPQHSLHSHPHSQMVNPTPMGSMMQQHSGHAGLPPAQMHGHHSGPIGGHHSHGPPPPQYPHHHSQQHQLGQNHGGHHSLPGQQQNFGPQQHQQQPHPPHSSHSHPPHQSSNFMMGGGPPNGYPAPNQNNNNGANNMNGMYHHPHHHHHHHHHPHMGHQTGMPNSNGSQPPNQSAPNGLGPGVNNVNTRATPPTSTTPNNSTGNTTTNTTSTGGGGGGRRGRKRNQQVKEEF
ncbi:LIM domain only protein-like protein [Euroglyphus maynei]|uniref:LIM domain only protein-like protein n=1 Tax=Euroglyphus maynei TaxID=6958 RepID=A0A1Y3BRF4_EURMA|nr:LIM domain only protein-like protein [Euroglyphus maynei]